MKKPTITRNRQKDKLDRFVLGLLNVTLVTPQIQPLIAVDTTAVFPLTQIYAETEHDFSEQGRVLNDSAHRLLTSMQTVSQSYHQQHRILINNNYCHLHKNRGQIDKQSKLAKAKSKIIPFVEMDQNYNLSNLSHLKNEDKKGRKTKVLQFDLKEIIRPEYRRKVQVTTNRVNYQQIESVPLQSTRRKNQIHTPRSNNINFLSSEHDIPLLKNRKNAQLIGIRGHHSKSPKVEGKKQHIVLSNISSISRNYQTQTDQSFQTDLHYMGLLQDKHSQSNSSKKSSSIIEGFVNDRKSYEQPHSHFKPQNNKIVPKFNRKYDRSSSAQIQEEQPWQCDEQQLEQELKEINARLSHRGYQTQRFKTEIQTFYQHPNEVENSARLYSNHPKETCEKRQLNAGDGIKKQPKTVRLSLTPVKSKSPIRKGDINHVKEISIIKRPIVQTAAANRKQKYKPYKVNCLIESEQSDIQERLFECGKWKKPTRGLITVQIQKFAKQN